MIIHGSLNVNLIKMKMLLRIFIALTLTFSLTATVMAQCETWTGKPNEDELTSAHSVYRQYLKDKQPADLVQISTEDFNIAFNNWKTVYDSAPAADGQRATHYADGRKLYMAMHNKTDDATKKKEYAEAIARLYDEQMQCYKNEAFLLGRKGYDMFYYLPSFGMSIDTYNTFKKAIEVGGNNTEYIVLDPMGQLMTHHYKNGNITKEEVVQMTEKLTAIAEHNQANNKQFGPYYGQGLGAMESHLAPIADEVFDCEYFKKKLIPTYEEDRNNLETVKYVYRKLTSQGCDTTDATVASVRVQYEKLAKAINDSLELVLRETNSGYYAAILQREGKYEEAVAKYQEAIEKEEDPEKKAQFYYSIAYIQTWQFSQYNSARENARKAASLRSGWGRPYLLIGDMYARSSASCGDGNWDARLAILAALEKYAYAKSIDGDVASDANERIGRYNGSKPLREDGFQRSLGEGDSVRVGCWIGETVTLRFK